MTSMDSMDVVESRNPKTNNAMQAAKGRSDTLKILDRQRIRGGLTKLNQSDDESIDDTTTYVDTANGEEVAMAMGMRMGMHAEDYNRDHLESRASTPSDG